MTVQPGLCQMTGSHDRAQRWLLSFIITHNPPISTSSARVGSFSPHSVEVKGEKVRGSMGKTCCRVIYITRTSLYKSKPCFVLRKKVGIKMTTVIILDDFQCFSMESCSGYLSH